METKGQRNGLCNKSSCLAKGANCYNRGSLSWYCKSCANLLNRANADVVFEDNKPMVIYIPETLSDDEAALRTKFTNIVRQNNYDTRK